MSSNYSYVREKLSNAIYALAVGQGDVCARLENAYLACFTLKPDDFPPECRKDWEWIVQQLTKRGPIFDYKGNVAIGSVANTMRIIKRKTGGKIAQKIYELNEHLNSEKYSL